MNEAEWKSFLTDYNAELLSYEEVVEALPRELIKTGWLGYPGASETEVVTAEKRLGTRLPPSYRAFLKASNGWRFPSVSIFDLLPADKVTWFREQNQDWIDAYVGPSAELSPISDKEYFVYGAKQDCVKFRTEYLQTALQISDVGDGAVILLNPKVVTPEGEWETWFFANCLPGAARYRSFAEWLVHERKACRKTLNPLPKAKVKRYVTAKKPVSVKKAQAFHHPERAADHSERLSRAVLSLTGLAIGDGIGEIMFSRPDRAFDMISRDELPAGPWWHTDDTEMAIGIVETLRLLGTIHQDSLARQFAWRFEREPDRGYGHGARIQLQAMIEGTPWRVTSREAFGGTGSLGNGSAMRVAPVGAWFADDLDRVVKEARASAMITHMHSEGVAGAVAVAVAAAMAWRLRNQRSEESVMEFFNEVHKRTPDGETRRGIAHAFEIRKMSSIPSAARMLGNGSGVTCPDTVPFAIWCAANHLHDFRQAIAATASVGGDSDTNCAIVGGIVALSTDWNGFPSEWLKGMEALPYALPSVRLRR